MSDRDQNRIQTPEEVLESEIEDLEQPLLRSWLPWAGGVVGLAALATLVASLVWWERGCYSGLGGGFQQAVELVDPRGTVAGPPRAFRWNSVEGAHSYIVTIRAADGEVIVMRPSSAAMLIPLDIELANFVPGSYVWTVEARDARAAVLGTGEASFRIGGS